MARRRGRRDHARHPAAPGAAGGLARRADAPGPRPRRPAERRLVGRPPDARRGRSPPRPSSTRRRPRPGGRSRPSTSGPTSPTPGTASCRRCGHRSRVGGRRVLEARRPPGACRPTTGDLSCAASPTTCWTSRRDRPTTAEALDALAATAREDCGCERAGVGRGARRAPGAGRRHRGDEQHRVPDRLDDEELHGGHRARPPRCRAGCGSTTRSRALAGVRATADSPPVTYRHLLSMDGGLPEDDSWADRHMDMTADDIERAGRSAGWSSPSRPARRSSTPTSGTSCSATTPPDTTAMLLEPLGLTRTTWTRPDHDDWVAAAGRHLDRRPRGVLRHGRAVVVRR